MSAKPNCDTCGKYIATAKLGASRAEITPLNEFGPEEIYWTCPPCLKAEQERRVCRG